MEKVTVKLAEIGFGDGNGGFYLGIGRYSCYGGNVANTTGFIMMGLGLVCFSISSKVILLAKVWKQSFALANRIPLIPVLTALLCLFLAAFLFEEGLYDNAFFVPARVLVGLGAICFCLFSIVSILESGTSKNESGCRRMKDLIRIFVKRYRIFYGE